MLRATVMNIRMPIDPTNVTPDRSMIAFLPAGNDRCREPRLDPIDARRVEAAGEGDLREPVSQPCHFHVHEIRPAMVIRRSICWRCYGNVTTSKRDVIVESPRVDDGLDRTVEPLTLAHAGRRRLLEQVDEIAEAPRPLFGGDFEDPVAEQVQAGAGRHGRLRSFVPARPGSAPTIMPGVLSGSGAAPSGATR